MAVHQLAGFFLIQPHRRGGCLQTWQSSSTDLLGETRVICIIEERTIYTGIANRIIQLSISYPFWQRTKKRLVVIPPRNKCGISLSDREYMISASNSPVLNAATVIPEEHSDISN